MLNVNPPLPLDLQHMLTLIINHSNKAANCSELLKGRIRLLDEARE